MQSGSPCRCYAARGLDREPSHGNDSTVLKSPGSAGALPDDTGGLGPHHRSASGRQDVIRLALSRVSARAPAAVDSGASAQ